MKKYFFITTITILLLISIFAINDLIIPLEPKNNQIITDTEPTFRWIGNADEIYIDDNPDFTSPLIQKTNGNNHKIGSRLDFGDYYWKLNGIKDSGIMHFTLDSLVSLELDQNSNDVNLVNTGTTDLDIEVKEKSKDSWVITGNIILEQDESLDLKIKNSTIFTARQK